MLPKEKSPVETDLSRLCISIQGEEKIGKSSLFANDEHLFLDVEHGLKFLSVFKVPVTSWDDFLNLGAELALTKPPYKGIVIDNTDVLAKWCADWVCKKLKVNHVSEKGWGAGYDTLESEFYTKLAKVHLLGYGLVLISHTQMAEVVIDGVKSTKLVPDLGKPIRRVVKRLADYSVYIGYESAVGRKAGMRYMWLRGTESIDAGARVPRADLPEKVPYGLQNLVIALTGQKDGQADSAISNSPSTR